MAKTLTIKFRPECKEDYMILKGDFSMKEDGNYVRFTAMETCFEVTTLVKVKVTKFIIPRSVMLWAVEEQESDNNE